MTLAAGTRLGRFEILGRLGAGGMGEVYRARDSRLGRDVALKVLPAHSAASPELRARLEREARAIAALNHPHICTLHDFEHEGGIDYLVMELVEGETLATRLARGPMPLAEVLRVGGQVAEALHRAHCAGILHRDLKPGNVMLTKHGAKLMDFGLARGAREVGHGGGLSQAPTESAPITGDGRLVGTFQYMAPEQLEGREPDVRSDIWSMGVTLYEMATGRLTFDGHSVASLISAIMKDHPQPLSEVVPMSPPALDQLVQSCLAKDPDARWQSAGDLAIQLNWISSGYGTGARGLDARGGIDGPRGGRHWLWVAGAAVILLTGAAGLIWSRLGSQLVSDRAVTRTELPLPNTGDQEISRNNFALSPDGRTLAIGMADSSGIMRIYIRRLSDLQLRPLPGSEGAYGPFWSPDSRSVAFGTEEGRLVRLGLEGGVPQAICDARGFAGGAWSSEGWIVFGTTTGPVMRVRDSGGDVQAVTVLDSTRRESSHSYPDFLPDGRHFTFIVDPGESVSRFQIRVGSIDGGAERVLMTAHHAPKSDHRGWLVYSRDRAMFAQRIDREGRRLLGKPISLHEAPERRGKSHASLVALSGSTLAYVSGDERPVSVFWFGRSGTPGSLLSKVDHNTIAPGISPSGKRAIIRRVQGGETWLVGMDLASGARQRLTSVEEWNSWPIWAHDADRLIYSFSEKLEGHFEIRSLDPVTPDEVRRIVDDSVWVNPVAVTAGDQELLYVRTGHSTGDDLYLVSMTAGGPSRPYAATKANEADAALLSDGKTAAFVSDVTGRPEIYLDDFPVRGRMVQVTHEGCAMPLGLRHFVWAVGNELVYCAKDGRTIRSIPLERVGGRWAPGKERELFVLPFDCYGFCPSADGSRFLVMMREGFPRALSLTLVQNWQAELYGGASAQ